VSAARRTPGTSSPVAFDGSVRPTFDTLGVLDPAMGPPVVGESSLTALVGGPVAMAPPVGLELRPEVGNNLAIAGAGRDTARALLQLSCLSIAAASPPQSAQFLLVDPAPGRDDAASSLTLGLTTLGANVTHLKSGEALRRQLGRLSALPVAGRPRRRIYLVGLDMDVFPALSVDGSALAEVLETGPIRGVHGIMWFGALTGPADLFGFGFLERYFLRRVLTEASRDELQSSDFLPAMPPPRPETRVRVDAWTRDEPGVIVRAVPPEPLTMPAMRDWLRARNLARWREPGSVT
jgi:hypothetical protein